MQGHWVVVTGTARTTQDDVKMVSGENKSTYIPLDAKHRLASHYKGPLHRIDVQAGGHMGKVDIVRFDDDYGREA